MAKTVEVKTHVKVPKVPNFVFMTNGHKMRVGDLDEETLEALGRGWTDALKENARRQKMAPK